MAEILSVSPEELHYASAVLRNRSSELHASHGRQYNALGDLVAGLPPTMQGILSDKLEILHQETRKITGQLSDHSAMLRNSAELYLNTDQPTAHIAQNPRG